MAHGGPIPFPPELLLDDNQFLQALDQALQEIGQPADNAGQAMRRRARYAATDWAHRHRLPDDQAKEVRVEPHMRRMPG